MTWFSQLGLYRLHFRLSFASSFRWRAEAVPKQKSDQFLPPVEERAPLEESHES
jgi:hypothetical protein